MMTKSRAWVWRIASVVLVVLWTLVTTSCRLSDAGLSAYLPADQFFAELSLEHHAINLSMIAPYDTVTLHATGTTGDGRQIAGDVTYSVSSPNLSVTNGILKAEKPVTNAVVRVTLRHGTITRTDSAIVTVIAGVPNRVRDFGIRLPTGDSAKHAVGSSKTIRLLREAESGANLSALLVSVMSSDTNVAKIVQSGNNVRVTPQRPGRTVVSASTYAFGAVWRDSLVFISGYPLQFLLPGVVQVPAGPATPILDFSYRDVTIGIGGCVVWVNQSESLYLDVQFADSTQARAPAGGTQCNAPILDPAVGGNIAPFRKIPVDESGSNALEAFFSPYAARVFSVPGVFLYRSAAHSTSGRVHVCDERNDTTCAPVRMGVW